MAAGKISAAFAISVASPFGEISALWVTDVDLDRGTVRVLHCAGPVRATEHPAGGQNVHAVPTPERGRQPSFSLPIGAASESEQPKITSTHNGVPSGGYLELSEDALGV